MMTDLTLDLTRSHGAIIVDGGLARIPAFTGLIAALRPVQAVLFGSNPNGSACGAAALAFEATAVRRSPRRAARSSRSGGGLGRVSRSMAGPRRAPLRTEARADRR